MPGATDCTVRESMAALGALATWTGRQHPVEARPGHGCATPRGARMLLGLRYRKQNARCRAPGTSLVYWAENQWQYGHDQPGRRGRPLVPRPNTSCVLAIILTLSRGHLDSEPNNGSSGAFSVTQPLDDWRALFADLGFLA